MNRLSANMNNTPSVKEDANLKTLVELLREEADEKKATTNAQMLADYAESKKQKRPTPVISIHPNNTMGQKISTKNPKGKDILIPENLDDLDQAIIKEFYDL